MGRTLTDAAVGDDILVGRDVFPTVNLAQFFRRFEGAIGVGGSGPGDALGGRDVPAAGCSLLWVVHHVQQFTGIFLRRTHIDQAAIGVFQAIEDIIAVRTYRLIPGLRVIGGCLKMRYLFGQLPAFSFPLLAPTVHDLHVGVAKHTEQPERITGIPVVLVAIQDNRCIVADTPAAHEFFKALLVDEVARHGVLYIDVPVEL